MQERVNLQEYTGADNCMCYIKICILILTCTLLCFKATSASTKITTVAHETTKKSEETASGRHPNDTVNKPAKHGKQTKGKLQQPNTI